MRTILSKRRGQAAEALGHTAGSWGCYFQRGASQLGVGSLQSEIAGLQVGSGASASTPHRGAGARATGPNSPMFEGHLWAESRRGPGEVGGREGTGFLPSVAERGCRPVWV